VVRRSPHAMGMVPGIHVLAPIVAIDQVDFAAGRRWSM
jgi:hypothetical protein